MTQTSVDTLATVWYQGRDGAQTSQQATAQTAYASMAGANTTTFQPTPQVAPQVAGTALAGRYRLEQTLGAGAFATVYAAWDLALQRWVAVKVYPAGSSGALSRAEAHLQATAQHPNLMPLYDSGNDAALGVSYLVMPLYPGADLAATLNRLGPMPFRAALLCVDQICSALEFLEQRQALHGDIKPANIWLTHSGAALLMDFNVNALLARSDVVRVGTPGYTAPEALAGRLDARSDVFSLGCVLYACLAGVAPFADDAAVQTGRYTPLRRARSEVRPALEAVVATALASDPARRYQSAREFRNALRFPEREASFWAGAIAPPLFWMMRLGHKAIIAIYWSLWRFLCRFGRRALRRPLQAIFELAIIWPIGVWLLLMALRPALLWLQLHRVEVTAVAAGAPTLLVAASCIRYKFRRRRKK
jgi:hypothetical protein